MQRKLAIIHTTPLTVGPLKALAAEMMPSCETMNIVDDSILPQLNGGGSLDDVAGRWRQYAQIAAGQGAHCILNACSSVGELVARVQPEIGVPIVRIDEPMAELAVRSGSAIGVAATLPTTLEPTARLMRDTAAREGRDVRLEPLLVADAYRKLLAGDAAGHDDELAVALTRLAERVDIVVLAQASMARVLERCGESTRRRCVSSPPTGMRRVADVLASL